MKKRMWMRIAMLAVVIVLLSACNRGVGCPSDFSVHVDGLHAVLPF